MPRRPRFDSLLLVFGALAFAIALLSIVDLLLPRPYDGVVLEADAPGTLRVREVVAGSGADRAGLRAGDVIVGIDRSLLTSTAHAARLLARRAIGEMVPYLVRRGADIEEVRGVVLGRRFIGNASYFFACLLGFGFLAVGLFVLHRRPGVRPAQIFFLVCVFFLLFLVCRLRPASYSWVDDVALRTGALSLLFLPACFLHFFLVFPQPVALRPAGGEPDFLRRRVQWLTSLGSIYLLPALVSLAAVGVASQRGRELRLLAGAPLPSWIVFCAFMLAGLVALAINGLRLADRRQRRGVALVLVGSLVGLVPFFVIAIGWPSWLYKDPWAFAALLPLALVPLVFAVAIVRFGLLDIRVVLRRSLVYAVVTAAVTALYAGVLTLFTALTRGSPLAASRFFPVVFALAILLLFEPLRRRSQALVDRFVFAERRRLGQAMRELGRELSLQLDPKAVVRDLVERLPQLLGLEFAALYLMRDGRLERAAGPASLPAELDADPELVGALGARRGGLVRLASVRGAGDVLRRSGVELVGELVSPRRRLGLVALSERAGQLGLEEEELGLLGSLLQQAAVALETGLLLEECTLQVELERELQIASRVQSELLPSSLGFAPGWQAAGACRPARRVGGDFYAELPGPRPGTSAVVFGDVAGKSVAGALVMMAAHEALQTLALSHRDPSELFALANQRLYRLGSKKSFVAVGWVAPAANGEGVEYVLAGQPQLLLRQRSGGVRELAAPPHRVPLGALLDGRYEVGRARVEPGELVIGYSDGVVDAQSPSGESFGIDRLCAVLAEAPGDADAVVATVLAAVTDFAHGAEAYDDITLVALVRDPEARS